MDIKVIIDTSSNVDLSAMSHEERELFFTQLREGLRLPIPLMTDFKEMQNDIITENALYLQPDSNDLLLRKLVQLSYYLDKNLYGINTTVIPIIQSKGTKAVNVVGGGVRVTILKFTGGKFRPMTRSAPAPRADAVIVRFDHSVFAVTDSGMEYIAAPGESLGVIGLVVNRLCAPPQKAAGTPLRSLCKHAGISSNDIMISNYHVSDLMCNKHFNCADMTMDIPLVTKFADMAVATTATTGIFHIIYNYLIGAIKYQHSKLAEDYCTAQIPTLNIPLPSTRGDIPPVDFKDINPFLRILESIHNSAFFDASEQSVIADITNLGFIRVYYDNMFGVDTSAAVSAYKTKQEQLIRLRKYVIATGVNREKLNTYRYIIEKKYGAKKLATFDAALLAKPQLRIDAVKTLGLLTAPERQVVTAEYDRRAKIISASSGNKCVHKITYTRFRAAKSNEQIFQYFDTLKGFFASGSGATSLIPCRVCKFDIICPHVVTMTESSRANLSYAESRAKITKYISESSSRGNYFCKICGETLIMDYSPTIDDRNIIDEELSSFIWGEMIQLLRYVKFDELIDPRQIASAMRDACYPFIYDIEKQIAKAKTNSAEEARAKKKLYTSIYGFAYLVKLASSKSGPTVTFKEVGRGSKGGSSTDIPGLIKHAIDIILTARNVTIREISGMNVDIIKNAIILAYKAVQSTGGIVIQFNEAEDLLTTILLDPVYKYYYTMNSIAQGKPIRAFGPVDSVDKILGSTVSALEKLPPSGDIYSAAKTPSYSKWNPDVFAKIIMPYNNHVKSPIVYWKSLYPGYIARSFEAFDRKIKSHLYREYMYADVNTDKSRKQQDFIAVMRPQWVKFHEQMQPLKDAEAALLKYKALEFVQVYRFIEVKDPKSTRAFINRNTPLGRLYDAQGRTHKWNLYVCVSGDKGEDKSRSNSGNTTTILTAAEIGKQVESGTRFTQHVVDNKCSICGVLKSEAGNVSDAMIIAALSANNNISNFYKYYEYRCPNGGLHEIVNKICTKCGYKGVGDIDYYNKYKGQYVQDRKVVVVPTQPQELPQATLPTTDYAEEYSAYTFDYNTVIELSEKLSINHRLIYALGAVERQEYADVQNGAYTPAEAGDRYDPRIFVLDSYIKNFLMEYNQIRYFYRIIKPSNDLTMIIDDSGYSRSGLANLPTLLPQVIGDYNARFTYVQQNLKPREIVTFCIQKFCELCLQVWNLDNAPTEQLRRLFVKSYMTRLLRSEELISKPGYFNWSLLYGDKDQKEKSESKERQHDDGEAEDGDDAATPMSLDAFDMEEDPEGEDADGVRIVEE